MLELGKTLQVEACFAPLVDVLIAMAEEDTNPRPIDKIAFLGETGLEQVEKNWPDLADFVRRAPRRDAQPLSWLLMRSRLNSAITRTGISFGQTASH